MRRSIPLLFALALVAVGSGHVTASEAVDLQALVGEWRVDLRPTPDADAYYQQFVVKRVGGGTLTGRFYNTKIRDARINTDWGALYFAFVTDDGSGVYHTSGVLRDGKIEGRTHALHRDFLAIWTAERAEPAAAAP